MMMKTAPTYLLSRLPLPDSPRVVPVPAETVMLMQSLETARVSAKQIQQWTQRDSVLSKVCNLVLKGWWTDTEDSQDLRPFRRRKDELSVENECVLWGQRVIVLRQGRQRVVEELHGGHPGTSRMKSLARSYVWWLGIDTDIVKPCADCQQNQKSPPKATLQPWDWPERQWLRVHADYALGRMFLILVDAHSKWIEVHPVTTANLQTTIKKMRFVCVTRNT